MFFEAPGLIGKKANVLKAEGVDVEEFHIPDKHRELLVVELGYVEGCDNKVLAF
jgi:hypothetical protein